MEAALSYKSNARTPRTAVIEEDYRSGISYTDSPLDGAFVKMLLNFDYKDDGTVMLPRGGMQAVATVPVPKNASGWAVHPFTAFTSNVDIAVPVNGITDYRTQCFMTSASNGTPYAPVGYSPDRRAVAYPNSATSLFVQDPSTDQFVLSTLSETLPGIPGTVAQGNFSYIGEGYKAANNVHGFNLSTIGPRAPISAVLNNVPYVIYSDSAVNPPLKLGKIQIVKDGNTIKHRCAPVTPMKLSVKEVLSSGYNMLLPEPYSFSNTSAAGWSIDGILPYTVVPAGQTKELLLTARPGQKVNFEVFYQYKTEADTKLRVKWEISSAENSNAWQVLQTEKATAADDESGAAISPDYTPGDAVSIDVEPTLNQFQVRVSFYLKKGTVIDTKPTKVMVMPIYKLVSDVNANTTNMKPAKYSIATASGIVNWKQRLVAWGVSGAENVLFASDVNNPTYFPYPNNIDIFDENIIHAVPYMDNLLVFTKTRIYMVTLMEDGIGFIKTLVQDRLNIATTDKYVIQVIKNMIFFKSANYYYMIVPKLNSIKGELIIAPVSKPITYLLDNFPTAVREIINTVYFATVPKDYDLNLVNYYNYVDNTLLRNVYTFEMKAVAGGEAFETFNFSFILNYDTTQRSWTTYCYQCNPYSIPFSQTITDRTTLLDVCNGQGSSDAVVAQLIKANPLDSRDLFALGTEAVERVFPNYQLLDTGYRKMGAQHKKVFREIQMKINNTSKKTLDYYTEFVLDDQTRKTYYTYEAQHVTDPNSPNYGLLYINRVFKPSMIVAGSTVLGEESKPQDHCWQLNVSKLANIATFKVRFPVSGKGYAPRLKLISFNERQYELLNINWVFRTLYMR